MHGRKHIEELVEGVAVVQVVEERLRGNSCAAKDESAAHQFGIGMDWTVIECQHVESVLASARMVNECLERARRLTTQSSAAAERGAVAAR